MLCYVMLCYVMSCYVMLCYVMSCYVMLCYVMSCHVMSCHVMSCHVMLCVDAPSVGRDILRSGSRIFSDAQLSDMAGRAIETAFSMSLLIL